MKNVTDIKYILSNIQVKEKKGKSKSEKKNKKKTNNSKSEYENLECFLNDE